MLSARAPCAVLGVLLLAGACKGSAAPPSSFAPDAGSETASLSFFFSTSLTCASGGLCAPPSQVVALNIASTVAGDIDVSLSGNYADAALTQSTVTLQDGHAQLSLETSSTPTTFAILARPSGSPTGTAATLQVVVGASGFARVLAVPSYAGDRKAPAFLAAAAVLATCSELDGRSADDAGSPVPDTQPWVTEPSGTPIALSVPAGERVAIEVRVGHYIQGCTDVAPLAATTTSSVPVTAYDVAMDLGQTDMTAKFDFAPTTAQGDAWLSAMSGAASVVASGFFASGDEATALLDAMAALVPSNAQAAFATSRTTGGWDAATETWLGDRAPSINARAVTRLAAASGAGLGELNLHLGPGTTTGTDPVTVTTFGNLTGALAAMTVPHAFSWTADADDTIHLAGAIDISAVPYVGHEADALAAAPDAGVTDVPSDIALQIDCAGLAANLVGSGDAYGACGASCTASLCAQAISTAWTAALAPGGTSDVLQISFTVGTPAQVGDDAQPIYFQSGWIGQVSEVSGSLLPTAFAIQGMVTGLTVSSQ